MKSMGLGRVVALGVLVLGTLTSCSGPAPSSSEMLAAQEIAPLLSIDSPMPGSFITAANSETFTLSGQCGYNGGTVSVQTTDPVFASTFCASNSWTVTLDVSFLFDGLITFDVNHVGPGGELAPTVTQSYTKDTIAPRGAKIVIGDGTTIPTNENVVLNLTAIDATRMYITNTPGCSSGGVDEPFAGSRAWVLQPVNGTATVYAIFRDDAGNSSSCVSASSPVDIRPIPIVAIASPAQGAYINLTNQSTFTLSGICSENGQNVMISGAITATTPCVDGAWSISVDFSGVPDGQIVVNADLKNDAGDPAVTSSRTFVKDSVAPTGTIAINGGTAGTVIQDVILTLASADAATMYITNSAGCTSGGVFEPYATSKDWVLAQKAGTATVYVAFRDLAGNVSPCVNDQIQVNPQALAISPLAISLPSSSIQYVHYTASGGSGGYRYSIVSGEGTVDPVTGLYTSPAGATGQTIVRVTDSIANFSDSIVTHMPDGVLPTKCYGIQVIGTKPKSPPMRDSRRRVMFIPLSGAVKVSLKEGSFGVTDGNGTDGSAALSIPNPDPGKTGTFDYAVYARLVGKPGTAIDQKTCGTDPLGPLVTFCNQTPLKMSRATGTPKAVDVSPELLFLSADSNADGTVDRIPVFDPRLQDYYWSLKGNGQVHIQLRFCLVSTATK